MKYTMPFVEIFISIHLLLAISSIFIGGRTFSAAPVFKLRIIRLIFISGILSPLAVYFLKPPQIPSITKIISIDTLQKSEPKVFHKNIFANENEESISKIFNSKAKNISVYLFIVSFIFLIFGAFYRIFILLKDMRKLKYILNSAQLYRKNGKIKIKVSSQCAIPFSVRIFQTAYIILPVSILYSSTNTKLAIAHEGQHHRQGDCLWAYIIEGIRIVFWGNPSLIRWQRIFNKLQELACDESLVGPQMISAHDYGRCLFQVAQAASHSHTSYQKFACTAQMAWSCDKKTESFITRRICMLSKYQSRGSYHTVLVSIFAISAIAGPLCTAYATKGILFPKNIPNEIDLTFLDARIQRIAIEEISAAVIRTHAKSGIIAVADARTGKIIAFAESGNVTETLSWKSRIFNPASTIKPFVAAAAIDAGVSSESQVYDCHEPYNVDGTKFTNGNPDIGYLSLTDAMIKSVNICLIKAAQDTGSEKFRQTLTIFGFDMNTPWNNDKSDALNLANAAEGISIPVTIAGLTKAYTVLANKGHLLTENSGEAVSEATAYSVTHMLEEAVSRGTAKRAVIADVSVAGKTGTLSNKEESTSLGLFAGYVPAEAPRFVSIVVMEDAHDYLSQGETSGGSVAAPVFHNVLEKSLSILSQ